MRFWIDVRLATEAGETVRRQRVSGELRGEDFEALNGKMVQCLEDVAVRYELEEDRSQVGFGAPQAAG